MKEGCTLYRDWREVAADKSLEGVLIATPPGRHFEMARLALDHGVPCFVEKPFTLDLAEARGLRDRAMAFGVPVLVNHIHLYNSTYQALKARVADQGGLRAVRMVSGNLGPFRSDCGPLWDWGSHDVALALDLAGGKPLGVTAEPLEQRMTANGPGALWSITLQFADEVTAEITTGNIMSPKSRRLEASCDGGNFVFDDQAPVAEGSGAAPPLDRALTGFAEAVRGERDLAVELDLAVSVIEVLTACGSPNN